MHSHSQTVGLYILINATEAGDNDTNNVPLIHQTLITWKTNRNRGLITPNQIGNIWQTNIFLLSSIIKSTDVHESRAVLRS